MTDIKYRSNMNYYSQTAHVPQRGDDSSVQHVDAVIHVPIFTFRRV